MADRSDPPPTIRDVATLAGVSVSSVSNFFHHPERMSEATRKRIGDAVDILRFAPNDAARRLRRGSSTVVGYLSHELASARTPAITNALARRLAVAGLHLLSAVDDGDADRERDYLDLFTRQRVTGLVVTPVGDLEAELSRLRAHGLPSVLCAHPAVDQAQPSVSIDHERGGRLAAEHLLSLGHRRLAFVTDTLDLSQVAARHRGALAALREHPEASLEILEVPTRSVDGGREGAALLADRGRRDVPDALLAVNDLVALGLCDGLLGRLSVPDDVAVMGYDDIEFARLGAVPLSTVRTPQDELGATAAELLLEQLGLHSPRASLSTTRQVRLRPELVVRASTTRRED